MAFVLIEHLVGDFETFKQVYLDDGERRRRSGSKGGKVFRAADDPNSITVIFEWDDTDRAREFAESLELHEAMRWSTSNVATPRVIVLEHVMDSEEWRLAKARLRCRREETRVVAHTGFGPVLPL